MITQFGRDFVSTIDPKIQERFAYCEALEMLDLSQGKRVDDSGSDSHTPRQTYTAFPDTLPLTVFSILAARH